MFKKRENFIDRFEKCFEKINNEKDQKIYKDMKDMIRRKYEKSEKYKCLNNIISERERIEYNLNQINSQFPAIAIALMIMFFSLLVPAISKVIANALSFNLESLIQIVYSGIIFIYIIKTIGDTSDEFRCLRLCKTVLEELEEDKLEEKKNDLNKLSDDVKDIKIFLGM